MRIKDMLSEETMIMNLQATNKQAAIDEMCQKLYDAKMITDLKAFKKRIVDRESLSTTGVGEGVGIPHGKDACVVKPVLCFAKSQAGVDFESLDGQPVNIFFMIAVPEASGDAHLKTLSKLARLLMIKEFKNGILKANTSQEVLDFVEKYDDDEEIVVENNDSKSKKIVCVTACPTGIAHTYMAAEKLEQAGKENGFNIKVETNGSSGVENRLTDQEIEEADGVIVAADTKVEMTRFAGKRLIEVPVSDGINKADKLLNEVLTAPIYQVSKTQTLKTNKPKTGIYKHLMSGVSNMLPFVVSGGILIALGFLLDFANIGSGTYGFSTQLSAFIFWSGKAAFAFMLPVLAGYIAYSIADRPGFVVGFVGGAMAGSIDYMVGAENIANGGSGFLGAILAGFAAGYLVNALKKLFSKLPKSLEGIKPVLLYPLFGVLGIAIIMILINAVVGPINNGLNNFLASLGTTNGAILGLIVGGMMAIDMGGPINKAAYAFGILTLEQGGSSPIMAAVMIGGMVPPLGIAIATTLFKKKFTVEEREAGRVNYVLGLSFITEGAIPFAAANPAKVIPATFAGSAIAGSLSMLFGSASPAPHGGLFVIPVITNPLFYILALVIGSFVTAFVLNILLPDLEK